MDSELEELQLMLNESITIQEGLSQYCFREQNVEKQAQDSLFPLSLSVNTKVQHELEDMPCPGAGNSLQTPLALFPVGQTVAESPETGTKHDSDDDSFYQNNKFCLHAQYSYILRITSQRK
jgi:hypothetical protein